MSTSSHADLALKFFGLRFVADTIEEQYRLWRNEKNLGVVRMTAGASIPAWIAPPLLGEFWFPELPLMKAFLIGQITVIPLMALTIFVSYSSLKKYATRLIAFTLLVAGLAIHWVVYINLNTINGDLSVILIMGSFALFMRLTPQQTLFAITPFMAIAFYILGHSYLNNSISQIDTFVHSGNLGLIYFFVTLFSVVSERFMRDAYVNEVVVSRQRQALQESQQAIEKTRDLIRRYIPPAVAAHIIDGNESNIDSPQRRRVTILFSDIVGFTNMADRLDAESMTQILNEYMAAMADIVEQHGGTLNEFMGDGLMALFGAPNEMLPEAQALNAVQAAQEMQARLPSLNEQWFKLGIGEPLQIRIGINTGVLSVGSFGSEGRMTYTAIGLQTNIAARIQSHCEPGGILLSDASWHLVKDGVDCEPKGEVECKGVHFPVKVYEPIRRH